MESLEEIFKKKEILTGTSEENTDTWSNANTGDLDTSCPLCNGAGFVHPLSESGEIDYSRVVPCECVQEELQRRKVEQLQKYSNLGVLSRLTFESLSPLGREEDQNSQNDFADAYDAAREFADEPRGWLIFCGSNGCGKTHLACAIANYRIIEGQPAFYISVADLLDHLRSTFHPESAIDYDVLFDQVKNTPLLVLDDLNTATATKWAKGKLEQLLNYRFNAQLPTVITTREDVVKLEDEMQSHLTDPDICRIYYINRKSSLFLESLDLELLSKMTFDNFDFKRLNLARDERQNLEQAYRIAFNFAQNPQGWLIFFGENGCGKTHLAAAIANHLNSTGKKASFIVVPDLFDHLRSTFSPESRVTYDELFEIVRRTPILILDDFGEQSATPWAQEKLYQLMNYRYNARLATVITTCISLDEIEARISSRMVDPSISLVYNIIAPDYRGDRKASKDSKSTRRNG
jgi:DNA replication protein DnaC